MLVLVERIDFLQFAESVGLDGKQRNSYFYQCLRCCMRSIIRILRRVRHDVVCSFQEMHQFV